MADDLPVGLLELAAKVDDGLSIDWDAEERAASDDSARAVIQGFRLLAGVAAVAQDGDIEAGAASWSPPPSRPPAVDASGTAWGPLRLEEAVGRGAFSQVYRARDPLGRDVAVKLLSPRVSGDDDPSARVLEEGTLLASVKHPNIVVVHGAETHDGRVGLWMEFVRGRTLAAEVDARGAHSADEAIVIGRALCGALAAVHAKGLIHGDVKAHNVMREEGGRVVLMDFGAGRSMQAWSPTVDLLAGTPLYLCPERLRGGAPTAATDIYSLGVLLYHLVTQDYPVEGATRAEVEAAHRAGARTRLRDRRPDLPDAFVSAVERALAPEPAARFASAGAFEEALGAAAMSTAARSDVAPRTLIGAGGPAWRRSRGLAIGLAAVAVLAIGTTVGLWRWAGAGALPAPPAAPKVDVSAGVPRFEVSGEFQQVLDQGRRRLEAGARIEPTMAVTFELQASREVYVYIVNEDERGHSYALFPLADTLHNPLAGGVTHVLPGGAPWEVDSTGGQEHLFVIVSPTPVPEIADAVAALPPASGEPRSEGKLAQTRGMGGRRRASAADAARPWRQQAQPLLPGRHQAEGLWVREFILKNP